MSIVKWLDQRKQWWRIFIIIFTVSVVVVGYIGYKTYEYAPPMCDFVDEDGQLVFAAEDIPQGQQVFLRYGLMEYGSFLGDGGMRGPDFTAEALNRVATWMNESYDEEWKSKFPDEDRRTAVVRTIVQEELKENRYDPDYYSSKGDTSEPKYQPGAVVLSKGQAEAFGKLEQYYTQMFAEGGDLVGDEVFQPTNYITDPEDVRQMTAFYFWGAWMCGAERPKPTGEEGFYGYSYTHNWPYDPLAGNTPKGQLVMWSIIGILVVIFSIASCFTSTEKSTRRK